MAEKTLYLLRHAESEYNKQLVIYGKLDSPLTKEGEQQVKNAAPFFTGIGLKQIVSSPLTRAKKTAEYINECLDLPIHIYDDLQEMYFGEWEGEKIDNWMPFRNKFWDGDASPPGGETKMEVFKRGEKVIKKICEDMNEYPVLVASHGMIIKIMLGEWFEDTSSKGISKFDMPNLALYKLVVDHEGDKFVPKSYEFIDIHSL
jgi:broad specificity phosphatase PhoE